MPSEKYRINAKDAIDVIVQAGGIPVWAHPLGGIGEPRLDKTEFEKRFDVLLKYGIKGLECYYSIYKLSEIGLLVDHAKENHLVISGGSDYHGEVKNIPLGKLLPDDSYRNDCVGRELTILQSLGIDKTDKRFKTCTYKEMKCLCKEINISYSGSLLEKIKNKEGYMYRKCFDSYTEVFDNSSLFKRRCYDKIRDYEDETVYESENGLINILVSDYDPLGLFDASCDKKDWYTVLAVSNYSEEFIGDIIKAYEEFYKSKIYHQRYESKYGSRWLVISDEEINDNDWSEFVKV